MPSPEQVQAAVDAYVAAYQENDRNAFLDAFATDGVIVDPVGTPPHAGREARGARRGPRKASSSSSRNPRNSTR